MYCKLLLLFITLLMLQPCHAKNSMYDDIKISPIEAIKNSPQLIQEYAEIQPYVYIPILNNVFTLFMPTPTSHKAKIKNYENELFLENHKNKIQEFKEIPLITLIIDKKNISSDNSIVKRFGLTEEDYEYKIKIIDLLETTYEFSKKQDISLDDATIISSIIYYTNSRDYKIYEHIISNKKLYDYNLSYIYYSLYDNKKTAKKVKKHILNNTFDKYYAEKTEYKTPSTTTSEIKEIVEVVTAPVVIPYQLLIAPIGQIYSNAHKEWKEDVKFEIYKEKRIKQNQ